MKRMRIHREGRTILLSLLTMLCVVNVLLYWHVKTNPIIVASLILSVLAFSFFLYFFRSPTRVIDIDDPSLIIAPADGKIVG